MAENTGNENKVEVKTENTNTGANGNGGELSAFDKFLQGEGMQAEFDRRIAKALKTQSDKAAQTMQEQINAAVAEALRVAKMTKEEQAQHEAQKKADDLTKRENAVLQRELKANAKETLVSKGLPVGLADTINYTSEETVNASIEALEKSFQASVQSAVDEKLKGGKPLTKADDTKADATEEMIKAAMKKGFYG